MSPERYSSGFAKHRREVKRTMAPQFPTWEIVEMQLQNQARETLTLGLYRKSRSIIREFYEARLEIAIGLGKDRFNDFMKEHYEKDPERFDSLSPFMNHIRDSLS